MRIRVHVLLNLESHALLFQLHADYHIQILVLLAGCFIPNATGIIFRRIRIFHIIARMMSIGCNIYTSLYEVGIQVVNAIIFSLQVDHRTRLALLVNQKQRRNMRVLSHFRVVGTKSWRNVHNARTIFCRHIIAQDNTKRLTRHFHIMLTTVSTVKAVLRMCLRKSLHKRSSKVVNLFTRLHPRHQLTIVQTF